MAGSDPALVATLQNRMGGDQRAVLKYPHLIGERVHFDDPLPGRVGNAVKIAADAHHAFMRDPPFQLQERAEGRQRQQFEMRLLLGECLVDDALGGGVHTRIGNRIEPMPQLGIQVVEIAEGAGEEEVLADIAKRPLDLALGFGPVRSAGLWLEAIVPGEVDERSVVDDAAAGLADDGGLHAVVKDLIGDAADRVERRHMAAQNRLHVLVQDKPCPDQPAEAEHEREQPDDARDRRLIRELQLELGEIDLCLVARRRLEANLKGRQPGRAKLAQRVGDGRVAALVSALATVPAAVGGRSGQGKPSPARANRQRMDQSGAGVASGGRRPAAPGHGAMHLRTVLRSTPSSRAIAETVSPCR